VLLRAGGKKAGISLLPKRERITSRDRIKAIIKNKQVHITSPTLNLAADVNREPFPRWVVICSKRLGGAVQRNRIRRLFNAVICKIRHKINKKMDLVVFPKVSGKAIERARIEAALVAALSKI
jgi:ribonuclease P protein component